MKHFKGKILILRKPFSRKKIKYTIYYTLNFLTLPKINTKRFGFYSFSFRASQLWNQLPDHIKYGTSVKVLRIN